MKRAFRKSLKFLALAAMTLVWGSSIISCTDDIDMENRFTFKGELVATYLENNPDRFSSFTYILSRATIGNDSLSSGSMLKTLGTYGEYTCFAPTNEAVDNYLKEQYELHLQGEQTGITSPYLEDIADTVALDIAKNHIIENSRIRIIDVNNGSFPKSTMNHRTTTMEIKVDEAGRDYPLLNGTAKVIEQDLYKENGYVHVIDHVLNPSKLLGHKQVGKHASFSLFFEALDSTQISRILETHEIDPSYDNTLKGPQFSNFTSGPAMYPETKYQKFTILVESDDLLADPTKNHLNLSIQSLEDLEWFAANWYGNITDRENREFDYKGDYANPQNPLYKFISYHIVDRQLSYSSSTGPGGFIMEGYKNREFDIDVNLPMTNDRYDYFETLLPYSILKVTKPFTNENEYIPYGSTEKNYYKNQIILNYAQEMGTRLIGENMKHHINVVVEDAETTKRRPGLEKFDQSAENAMVHTLDRILIYNEAEMRDNVLNERMRWDASSLFPELTNNEVRWMLATESGDTNGDVVFIPRGYCSRLKFNNGSTNLYYMRPHKTTLKGGYATYMGDEILANSDAAYDFEYRLPYVPTGTYEIRFGFNQSDARGVCQFYVGGKICGIPVDMNESSAADLIGWFEEEIDGKEISDEEKMEGDKSMRNRGWMKGAASCYLEANKNMRYSKKAIRKVLGTFYLENGYDYWIRFKDVTDPGKLKEFSQDYLEIVPISVINGEKPEDNK